LRLLALPHPETLPLRLACCVRLPGRTSPLALVPGAIGSGSRCAKTHVAEGLGCPASLPARTLASRNAGVGFTRGIGKLCAPVGWATTVWNLYACGPQNT
jgi:hypothetical protein